MNFRWKETCAKALWQKCIWPLKEVRLVGGEWVGSKAGRPIRG